jgi:hypothetical protein
MQQSPESILRSLPVGRIHHRHPQSPDDRLKLSDPLEGSEHLPLHNGALHCGCVL